ncbi:hypothetical protein NL676_029655 [Syzygium grande]|nr:hypothetical protein NL676_029655 [Syzygium grande]
MVNVLDALYLPIPIPFDSEYPLIWKRWEPLMVSVIDVDEEEGEDEEASTNSLREWGTGRWGIWASVGMRGENLRGKGGSGNLRFGIEEGLCDFGEGDA